MHRYLRNAVHYSVKWKFRYFLTAVWFVPFSWKMRFEPFPTDLISMKRRRVLVASSSPPPPFLIRNFRIADSFDAIYFEVFFHFVSLFTWIRSSTFHHLLPYSSLSRKYCNVLANVFAEKEGNFSSTLLRTQFSYIKGCHLRLMCSRIVSVWSKRGSTRLRFTLPAAKWSSSEKFISRSFAASPSIAGFRIIGLFWPSTEHSLLMIRH